MNASPLNLVRCAILVSFAASVALPVVAQSGGAFTVTQSVVANGGGKSAGGAFGVSGTSGQHAAGTTASQAPFSVSGGFWPASLSPTASSSSVGGRIVDQNGTPVAGVVVQLNGMQARKTITDSNGNYQFDNIETGGFYTLTPTRVNYGFSPFNRSFSQIGNRTDAIFTAISLGDHSNPLDTAEYLVRQQYLDMLSREPDEYGFNFWSNQILACGNDARCIRSRRIEVSAAFFIELEAQETGSFIYDIYSGTLGRKPMFAEYSIDRQHVIGGPTLDEQKNAFARAFVQRDEFLRKYQDAPTAESFVDALIRSVSAAGADLSAERTNLITLYNREDNTIASRATVVGSLADNSTLKQSQYNRAFVLSEYFAYLHRDADSNGFDFWVTVLNSDGSNYKGMVCSFITSAEYQRRFSTVVSHNNSECSEQ